MPNVGKIVAGVAKAVSKKKAASASARGLKAAKGPSMAPKGYVSDTVGRAAVKKLQTDGVYSKVAGQYFKLTPKEAMYVVSGNRSTRKNPAFEGAVKITNNVVSKSGRKANTPKLMKKAAKKGK